MLPIRISQLEQNLSAPISISSANKQIDSNQGTTDSPPKQRPSTDLREISTDLVANAAYLRHEFTNCADINFRNFYITDIECLMLWVDGLINEQLVQNIFQVLMLDIVGKHIPKRSGHNLAEYMNQHFVPHYSTDLVIHLSELKRWIMMSKLILLFDGCPVAIMLDAGSTPVRSITEPTLEASLAGPRDCFVELLRTNSALIRSKLGDSRLKCENFILGRRSVTLVNLMYIEDVAQSCVIEEVRQRIRRIDIDAILDSTYLKELIQDKPLSLFPLMKNTERPDKVVADLLEGKFALIVDGSPMVLTAPCVLAEFLQAADDHYNNPMVVWFIRFVRYVSLFTATTLPGAYVAVTTFHQEMIPIPLVFSIAAAHQFIPFPSAIETIIMVFILEMMVETGVRLPRIIGPIGSMVGALIMGQIAIMAGFISSSVAIVVAAAAISNFILGAGYALASPIRLIRFAILLSGGILGLYGINLVILALLIHLASLRSFGIPYLAPFAPLIWQDMRDIIYRAPRWALILRPSQTTGDNVRRSNTKKPSPPATDHSSRYQNKSGEK